MTYSKEKYDDDLKALQEAYLKTRANVTWKPEDIYPYISILEARLKNFFSYDAQNQIRY